MRRLLVLSLLLFFFCVPSAKSIVNITVQFDGVLLHDEGWTSLEYGYYENTSEGLRFLLSPPHQTNQTPRGEYALEVSLSSEEWLLVVMQHIESREQCYLTEQYGGTFTDSFMKQIELSDAATGWYRLFVRVDSESVWTRLFYLAETQSPTSNGMMPQKQYFAADNWYNDTIILAYNGTAGPDNEVGNYTRTHALDTVDYAGEKSGAGEAYVNLNFTTSGTISGFEYAVSGSGYFYDDSDLLVYDWNSLGWAMLKQDGESDASGNLWYNETTYNSNYWSGNEVILRLNSTGAGPTCGAAIDYAELTTYYAASDFTDYFVTPERPYDDEEVMFTAVTNPDDEIESAILNVVLSPSGFNDTDYSMSEGPDAVFVYTFSTLNAGHYIFTMRLENSTAIVYSAYISLSVTVTEIDIDPISFFGASPDSSTITFSFECNKDGTYTIMEWTSGHEDAATVTATGSVIDGYNSISWDKQTGDPGTVLFNFTITNGSLTATWDSQYQYYVPPEDYGNPGAGAAAIEPARAAYQVSTYTLIAVIALAVFVVFQARKEGNV